MTGEVQSLMSDVLLPVCKWLALGCLGVWLWLSFASAVRRQLAKLRRVASPFAALVMVLALAKFFEVGATTRGSFAISWRNAVLHTNSSVMVDAEMELLRNGDRRIVLGGVTNFIERVLPFAHAGFGQDEEWVTANFTNAAEIASSDTFLDGWYQGLTMADVPANSDWISTNKWLEVKRNAIVDMSFNPAVRDSTNCWMAVAREHGNIRARLIDEAEWDSLLGLDECEREAGSNGVEVISVPGLFSERWAQREKEVRQMKQDQSNREYYAAGIRLALKEFARSERIACLSPQSRNAMVSNIVETARLTQEEACALGWTNVAVSVSQ